MPLLDRRMLRDGAAGAAARSRFSPLSARCVLSATDPRPPYPPCCTLGLARPQKKLSPT